MFTSLVSLSDIFMSHTRSGRNVQRRTVRGKRVLLRRSVSVGTETSCTRAVADPPCAPLVFEQAWKRAGRVFLSPLFGSVCRTLRQAREHTAQARSQGSGIRIRDTPDGRGRPMPEADGAPCPPTCLAATATGGSAYFHRSCPEAGLRSAGFPPGAVLQLRKGQHLGKAVLV